ncbi:MAG: glycosyltransferase family 2 protein [Prevotellaceae bacterium]|jgi:glycosyltransferase involved in cell wall biosynthesis|nr:glycosyltransferase family 2 protein [Prevotellaceae bacterium]
MIPKVSILVPVYNVSKYIERCAHSLFQQTFDDIEYVFINDCTPDDSIEKLQKVIEQYPHRKQNVKIIHHKKNHGLATTRNTAIDNSSGQYIQVVDSDDWIEKDMIETMYKKAIEENADVVTSDIFIEDKGKTIRKYDIVASNQAENFRYYLTEICIQNLVNKLVKREFYEQNDNRVPDGLNILEDRHVMIRIYYVAKRIVRVDKAFYHYVRNQDSLTKKIGETHFGNIETFFELLRFYLKRNGIFEKYYFDFIKLKLSFDVEFFCNPIYYKSPFFYQFRDVYEENILRNKDFLKPVEKLMFFFTRHRLLIFTQLIRCLLLIKSYAKMK